MESCETILKTFQPHHLTYSHQNMQQGCRWIRFATGHREHYKAFWGKLPNDVEPHLGMQIQTGKQIRQDKWKKENAGAKPNKDNDNHFELDGQTETVDAFLPLIDQKTTKNNLYAVGLNYKSHAIEVEMPLPKHPVTLLLASNSITGHETNVVVPKVAQYPLEIDYEVELGIIISKQCKDVDVDDAMNHVLGYTIANDISARRWQGKRGGGQWSRSKGFDTFTPIGPTVYIPSKNVITGQLDRNPNLKLTSKVNGVLYQSSNTKDMIFNPAGKKKRRTRKI